MDRSVKIEQHGGLGVLWCIGWLFTIGYLKTGFWKGVLALLVWPYFLGAEFAPTGAPTPVERTPDAQ
ncbi:MAG TPA: hypothetical protein PKM48_01310 [Parvularculaceae bacterium]|nr:hypothetical protein [Parvularculaceae bacterium]HNS88079.1 hypothetical protein [Parvularculaceae bacterium]